MRYYYGYGPVSNISLMSGNQFVSHHQVGGKAAEGFWADWIGTLVAMVTYS